MADDELLDLAQKHLIRYAREFAPFVVSRAEGSWIWDTEGNKYLDFTSGQICSTIGHNHPRIVEAVRKASERAFHLNSWMLSEEVIRLAQRLVELSPDPLNKAILLNTGSESNEVGLRMAKLATGGFEVAGVDLSFHGLTTGVAGVTFSVPYKGYGPRPPGTFALPAPHAFRCPIKRDARGLPPHEGCCDMACLERGFEIFDANSAGALAAVIVEPVLSAGGVIDPPQGYLKRLQELTHERGGLLVVDEAQTGFGRLGTMFGFEQDGIVPDVLTVSKTLGGGLPIAATIVSDEFEATAVERGFFHVTSHVSDPLPAAVGLAVLDVIEEEGLVERAGKMGELLRQGLEELAQKYEVIGDVRGRGLLLGVELVKDRETREPAAELGEAVTNECLRRGLSMNIVRGMGASIWRIAPPLTANESEVEYGLRIIGSALRRMWGSVPLRRTLGD